MALIAGPTLVSAFLRAANFNATHTPVQTASVLTEFITLGPAADHKTTVVFIESLQLNITMEGSAGRLNLIFLEPMLFEPGLETSLGGRDRLALDEPNIWLISPT